MVQVGPGIAPDVIDYVRERLGALEKYAPRPVAAISATVTRQHDSKQRHAVEVRASLTIGDHVLRSHEVTESTRASLDVVCDRLRRQLTELPHGSRGDHVPHRRNSHG